MEDVLELFRGKEVHGRMDIKDISTGVAIVTFSPERAERKLLELHENLGGEIRLNVDTKTLEADNGVRYVWIKPYNYSRGYACYKALFDKNLLDDTNHITRENILYNIESFCRHCGEEDVELF